MRAGLETNGGCVNLTTVQRHTVLTRPRPVPSVRAPHPHLPPCLPHLPPGHPQPATHCASANSPNQCLLFKLVNGHHCVDQAHVQSLLGIVHAGKEPHLTRLLLTCQGVRHSVGQVSHLRRWADTEPPPLLPAPPPCCLPCLCCAALPMMRAICVEP